MMHSDIVAARISTFWFYPLYNSPSPAPPFPLVLFSLHTQLKVGVGGGVPVSAEAGAFRKKLCMANLIRPPGTVLHLNMVAMEQEPR